MDKVYSNSHFGKDKKGEGLEPAPTQEFNSKLSMHYKQATGCRFVGAGSKPAWFCSRCELL